jgi:hypothetical protein
VFISRVTGKITGNTRRERRSKTDCYSAIPRIWRVSSPSKYRSAWCHAIFHISSKLFAFFQEKSSRALIFHPLPFWRTPSGRLWHMVCAIKSLDEKKSHQTNNPSQASLSAAYVCMVRSFASARSHAPGRKYHQSRYLSCL